MLRLLLAIKPIDIIIIAVLAAAIVGIVAFLVIRKKKGISGCGCGCTSCPHAGGCPSSKEKTEEKKEDNNGEI